MRHKRAWAHAALLGCDMVTTPQLPIEDLQSLCQHLREVFDELSPRLQAVARYLLAHPQEVPIQSMRQLAQRAGVHPTAVLRFSQRMGYPNWQALRQPFVLALQGGPTPYALRAQRIVQTGPSLQAVDAVVLALQQNLDLLRASDPALMARAVALLEGAKRVYVAGFRASFSLAFTFHYEYRLFRDSVHLLRSDAGTLELELRPIGPEDALVVFGFAPYSSEAVRAVQAAQANGCQVLAVSDSVLSPIARQANATLLFSIEGPAFFPSIAAGIGLVEVLVDQLLARQGPQVVTQLQRVEGQLRQSGAYLPSSEVADQGQRPAQAGAAARDSGPANGPN